ncbi:hypothetical protein BSK59_33225 [Paenibacillus odorifer]|uniref:hypothetical protein n=1 Tax=Paenibacillus odorifer TaxID=189426 RepID=UPI00096C785D|nr:hypothetical protein [Paenibacillus odorifer]OME44712.1 hypothetical protein BSK59_33225 [Paenibacillus odorifer]
MATIGQVLPTPESGWRRYEEDSPLFVYGGSWESLTEAQSSGGKYKRTGKSATVKFAFVGTKLRIVTIGWNNRHKDNKLVIDGVTYNVDTSISDVYKMLAFDIQGLSNTAHTVTYTTGTDGTYGDWDAIDIDSTGRLYHPDEVTKIEDLTIGKRIRCHYQSTISGNVGTFSGLGQETSDFIPVTSSATPNGDFYFIMIENWNGQKRLIADRNVQHSISWDALNTSGIASGSGLPINILNDKETIASIRLLTGGETSASKDNEWDKYIVSSTLNGTIKAGDDNVWNWNPTVSTWTSTTPPSNSAQRVARGYNADINTHVGSVSSTVGVIRGFRPTLLIDSQLLNNSFILFNGEYKKWAEGTPTIEESFSLATPKMTSNTTPSGRVFSDTVFSSAYDPWMVFNQVDDGEGYASGNGSGGKGFLGYQFPSAVVITKYVIRSMTGSNHLDKMPKDWSFEGSNDSTNGTDGTWVVLDSRTSQIWTTITTDKEYFISNPKSFITYRLRWTANNGVASYTDINELKMYSYIPYVPATPSSWKTISTTLPSVDNFKSEGMSDLSILDRKPTTFTFPMDDNGVSGTVLGGGKVFKEKIDLKRFFDVNSLSVK